MHKANPLRTLRLGQFQIIIEIESSTKKKKDKLIIQTGIIYSMKPRLYEWTLTDYSSTSQQAFCLNQTATIRSLPKARLSFETDYRAKKTKEEEKKKKTLLSLSVLQKRELISSAEMPESWTPRLKHCLARVLRVLIATGWLGLSAKLD